MVPRPLSVRTGCTAQRHEPASVESGMLSSRPEHAVVLQVGEYYTTINRRCSRASYPPPQGAAAPLGVPWHQH